MPSLSVDELMSVIIFKVLRATTVIVALAVGWSAHAD